jgi:hypothetical protein
MKRLLVLCAACLLGLPAIAQTYNPQVGAWYMYFFQKRYAESRFGFQGDLQYRAWNLGRDTEQLLLRGGITYTPATNDITFTLGYAFVGTGAIGEPDALAPEHRMYQEALTPQPLLGRVFLTHRFRYEQRWVQNQAFRTRFRYMLFLNVPINRAKLEPGAVYTALYNEVFLNGERVQVAGAAVQLFDRNRTYLGAGYVVTKRSRLQLGMMRQVTPAAAKWQLQLSLHQNL